MKLALFAASFALCISSVRAEVIRFYHPDAQENLIAMTDDQGHVVWRAEPAPFADYTRHPPDHPQRFLDQPQEPNGLFEIGVRWYDPHFGRFMTPDPAPFTTADLARPGALNRYAYGLNNPYRFHDLSGADPAETSPPPDMMTQAARDFDPDLWKQALKFGIYQGVCLRLPGVCDLAEAVAGAGEEGEIDILMAAKPGLGKAAGGGRGAPSPIDWDKVAKFKYESFERLGADHQKAALNAIDAFQKRFMAGAGEPLSQIRNLNNLSGGQLWEIKHKLPFRVYLDKGGNVIGYGTKTTQGRDITRLKNLLHLE